MCFYNEAENNMSHTWTYAGNPDYFPYEGMKCDCGSEEYHKSMTSKKKCKPSMKKQECNHEYKLAGGERDKTWQCIKCKNVTQYEPQTQPEEWEESFNKVWAEYPKNHRENTKGLDFIIKDFISNLLEKERKEELIKLLAKMESCEDARACRHILKEILLKK